jgi:uracil-DNA glycosylase
MVARLGIQISPSKACRGARRTAAHEILGRPIVLAKTRGQVMTLQDGRRVLATTHPSAILPMPDEDARHQAFAEFVGDLKQAFRIAKSLV